MTAHVIYLYRPRPIRSQEPEPVKHHVNKYLLRELRTEAEARAERERRESMQ